MNIKLYTKTSAQPREYSDVNDIITEGALIRLVFGSGLSEWYPLVEVYRIKETTPRGKSADDET